MKERAIEELILRLKVISSMRKGLGIHAPVPVPRARIDMLVRAGRAAPIGQGWQVDDVKMVDADA